jgi:site-specific DNA-methyltransferase (adenine-specific)
VTQPWSLLSGDALTILPTLEPESFDAIVTDPPYASGGLRTTDRRATGNDKYLNSENRNLYPLFTEGEMRDQRSWTGWLAEVLSRCYRVAKPGAVLVLFSDWRQLPATTDAIQWAGWTWRGLVPWDKTGAARPQRGRYTQQAEFIPWASKGEMPLEREYLGGYLPGVYRHRVDPTVKKHVTGKPVPLMFDLLQICAPGGRVLDPFCGSGSTGVAALRHGLHFTGIEMSAEYLEIARAELTDAETALGPVRRHGAEQQLTLA